jgi:hypothetical protein
MCDHVWIFEAKDAEHAARPATMRHVRCIRMEPKVPRTGHIDMRTSGWRRGDDFMSICNDTPKMPMKVGWFLE